MEPTRGLTFRHTKWLDDEYRPLVMKITRIARGTVYYRALDGSLPTCCPIEDFGKYAERTGE